MLQDSQHFKWGMRWTTHIISNPFYRQMQFTHLLVSSHACQARYQSLEPFIEESVLHIIVLPFARNNRQSRKRKTHASLITNVAMITVICSSARSLRAWSLVLPLPGFILHYLKISIQLSKMIHSDCTLIGSITE